MLAVGPGTGPAVRPSQACQSPTPELTGWERARGGSCCAAGWQARRTRRAYVCASSASASSGAGGENQNSTVEDVERVGSSQSATTSSAGSPVCVTEKWFSDFFNEVLEQELQEEKTSVRQKARSVLPKRVVL